MSITGFGSYRFKFNKIDYILYIKYNIRQNLKLLLQKVYPKGYFLFEILFSPNYRQLYATSMNLAKMTEAQRMSFPDLAACNIQISSVNIYCQNCELPARFLNGFLSNFNPSNFLAINHRIL